MALGTWLSGDGGSAGGWLGSMLSEVFFSLKDSVIP